MARAPASLFAFAVVGILLVSGCTRRPNGDDHGTATPTNACSAFPAPGLDESSPGVIRGANAFAYVLGLVCDHSGAYPIERPRVPGTSNHTQGLEFLTAAVQGLGLQLHVQNFTGSEYEGIMNRPENANSQARYYFTACDPSNLPRMRGLAFSNVEAKGGTVGGPIVLLMAHWESKRFAEEDPVVANHSRPVLGANDGASGVGALLELARVLKSENTPFEVRLLFTDGEDGFAATDCHPLAGSTYYADTLPEADRARLRGIILLDMVGDPAAGFYKCGSDTALADRVWAVASRLDVRQFKQDGTCGGIIDDHSPFQDRGMKAIDIVHYPPFPPYWHTVHDTPDKLKDDVLGNVARVLHDTIKELPPAAAP